jgi:hypothetical protein
MTVEQSKPDIAKMGAKLRLQVCELLKLNPAALSAADEVLVSRIGSLRLLVSDLESAQLRGERIDLPLYLEASKALEDALRTDHRMMEGSPAAEEDARQKMREVLMRIAPEIVEASDAEDREATERAQLAEQDDDPDLAAEPKPAEPAPPATPPPSNVKYLSTRTVDGKPPRHYLRQDNSDGGVICAKPWKPPGGWR